MRYLIWVCLLPLLLMAQEDIPIREDAKGTLEYNDFEKPESCASCHVDIYQQWTQSMMAQSFTHHWDEIEYFDLAEAHAEAVPELRPVVDGCNGCHTPMAFLAGDLPPSRPEKGTRANEGVSCDVCHTIVHAKGDPPYNYSYQIDPGRLKYGNKPGLESPHHDTEYNAFYETSEYCADCHNEQSPFGVWVKSTQIEWKEGPYGRDNVTCQVCHMPKALGKNAKMAKQDTVSQHLFHGAHSPGKVAGAIEVRMHPKEREVPWDAVVVLEVQLFNGKCGHKVPSGSVEDRIMWLHVTATDAQGKTYHLPVDKKGFEGEEYTIASDVLAYQDMGVPLGKPDFKGVRREDVPIGDRIFRMPYFDPEGRMTIMQWNTKSLGVDYRIGPRETKIETYTWRLPDDIPVGKITFNAQLNFRKLVKPVADLLGVPEDESEIMPVNSTTTWVQVYEP